MKLKNEMPVKEMCEGCGHMHPVKCDIITEPGWMFKNRNGQCFAKTTPEKLAEIEAEIKHGKTRYKNR